MPAGAGWPADPAGPDTPVADSPQRVEQVARGARALADVDAAVSVCRACPRLVTWREQVAAQPRRSFADQAYWGRPVPGWGDPTARLLVLGLAPAAHGGNRTGRVFTGDRSGDWIFAALYRHGLVSQPHSVDAADGQAAWGVRVTAAVKCAPPDNRPSTAERDTCAGWLDRELEIMGPQLSAVLALGGFAFDAALAAGRRAGWLVPRPRPRFGHGVQVELGRQGAGPVLLVGSYHVSQQNTFTGRLTQAMLDDVLAGLTHRLGLSPS